MYIIELLIKLKQDIKQGRLKPFWKKPERIKTTTEKEQCDHFFVPIDSTGRVLACSKCGILYKLKKNEVNPFK